MAAVFLVAAIVLASLVIVRASRRGSARRDDGSTARPQGAIPAAVPRQVDQWQVDLHETARDLSARLDSKMVLLDQLIRQAASEADRLERAIARAQQGEAAGTRDESPAPQQEP